VHNLYVHTYMCITYMSILILISAYIVRASVDNIGKSCDELSKMQRGYDKEVDVS